MNLRGIEIFFKEKVGNLPINKIDTINIRYGAINFRLIICFKSDSSCIKGNKIKIAPIGDGIPSK